MYIYAIFLCWGSFLNVAAYRLIRNKSFIFGRSACTSCNTQIAWYDNIPILSWLLLGARCRTCSQPISALYPFIELLTLILLSLLYTQFNTQQFVAYFIFVSALIVTIRSDLETMLISRYVTLFLIPAGFVLSALGWTTISPLESVIGAATGYGFLYAVSKTFTYFTGKQGIGQGDLDLLSFIGAFIGVIGWWISLLLGSIAGSIIGIFYVLLARHANPKIPFGPFLALGAILFIFFEPYLIDLFLAI